MHVTLLLCTVNSNILHPAPNILDESELRTIYMYDRMEFNLQLSTFHGQM